jgi:predicted enzyme related to lactoylglutathione lyase
MNGQVVHFEIPADDVERARGFYREAFGWQLAPVPDMDYTMVTTTPSGPEGMPTEPGAINGGMLARQ